METVSWNIRDIPVRSDRPDCETPPPPPPPIDDPIEPGPGEETDINGIPQGWRCRACGGLHTGGGCPEVAKLLYAPALAYQPDVLVRAHADRTLLSLLCSLDRIELEAHALALACYLIDSGATARHKPARYDALPTYIALILRRWRAMLATRPIGVVYEAMAC
jgi:hypothetical protein